MTPQTKQKLKCRAAEAHMTLTDYMCICGLENRIVQAEGMDKVLSELKAQGRNLNQLTILANMGKLRILRADDLASGYAKLCELINQIIKEMK